MKSQLLTFFVAIILLYGCAAPPVTKNKDAPNEEVDSDGLENYMEYHRYLREVVNTLEADPEFKKKLEKASEDDIRSGKIAHELEFVNHHVRTRLDEIKRTELARLRELTEKKKELMENEIMDDPTHHHLDKENPHTFEIEDLKKLIAKTTEDLAEADRKRREEFKQYELQKEFEKQEKLNHTNGEEREKLEKEFKEMEEKHKQHEKLHEPGHKQQLEEVWEEQDQMDQEFDPKTFFMLHDLDSNGLWDETEVKALFIKELDKMYAAGAQEDDMRERAEEMERMREAVFREVDTNKDGFIDYDEFLVQTKRNEFQQDHGWQGLDEQKIYTDEELQEYVRQHQAQQAYYQHQMPPPGMPHPGQMPPPGMPAYQGQMPPPGMQHPGQQQGMGHPAQMAGQQQGIGPHPAQLSGQQHPAQMTGQQQGVPHPGQMAQQGMPQHPAQQAPPAQYQQQYNNHQVPPGGYQQNLGHGQVPVQGQQHQMPQAPHPNVQYNPPQQQGNMPDVNTNEVYPNQQQQQYAAQPQNSNQGNARPLSDQHQQLNYQNQQPNQQPNLSNDINKAAQTH